MSSGVEKSTYTGKKESVVKYFATLMENFEDDDNLSLSVEKIGNLASKRQENLYWRIVSYICKETGNDKDDMHRYFKTEILNNKMMLGKTSLKDLTSKDMASFLEHIRMWAHENEFTLPI
jgi:hypothetical protein